jgi:two-component system invasion response regulator UvrY
MDLLSKNGSGLIKVLVIDDHTLVLSAIKSTLQDVAEIKIVGEAYRGVEGVQFARELRPDVVILDFNLPDITGLETVNRLLRNDPNIKILVITATVNELFPFRILEAGAKGYLTKDCSKNELIRAIKAVYSGQNIISPHIASRLALAKVDNKERSQFDELTDREMEVMMMVIRGVMVNDIADRLFLSPKTVHSYRSRIFEKLKVENEVSLLLMAMKKGLIHIEEAETQSE